MTEEEYFRKTYPDFCYSSGKPLSPYWDLFQDGVEFGERQSEKKIAELEKENAKQVVLNDFKSRVETLTDRFNKKSSQLSKVKVALRKVVDYLGQFCSDYPDCVIEAEQFLKDLEK